MRVVAVVIVVVVVVVVVIVVVVGVLIHYCFIRIVVLNLMREMIVLSRICTRLYTLIFFALVISNCNMTVDALKK